MSNCYRNPFWAAAKILPKSYDSWSARRYTLKTTERKRLLTVDRVVVSNVKLVGQRGFVTYRIAMGFVPNIPGRALHGAHYRAPGPG